MRVGAGCVVWTFILLVISSFFLMGGFFYLKSLELSKNTNGNATFHLNSLRSDGSKALHHMHANNFNISAQDFRP